MMGKGTGNKKHNWQAQNRLREGKSIIGNREAKKFICITHGHELRGAGDAGVWDGAGWRGDKGKKKIEKTVIA